MNKLEFPLLKAEQIEVRVASVKPSGCSLLLYKDARTDMDILDEVVGALNWRREHSRDNANCTISIWCEEKNQWIGKEDTGTVSNAEAEKGPASDSFKRAAFNWGIGRELYTAPFIWVSKDNVEIKDGKTYDKFSVSKIEYRGKLITALEIRNDTKNVTAYRMGSQEQRTDNPPTKVSKAQLDILRNMADEISAGYKLLGKNKSAASIISKLEKIGKKLDDFTANEAAAAIEFLAKSKLDVPKVDTNTGEVAEGDFIEINTSTGESA